MKHRLEMVVLLPAFAISMIAVAASESNKTRLNSEAETECTPLCCYNDTSFVAGTFDCEESAANETRQEKRVPKIYGTDFLSRNIGISNITDNITYSVVEISPQYLNGCISDEEYMVQSQFVYSCGMLITVPFLIATYVVYWLLPELRNVHGQMLLQYVGCLIVTYSTLGVTWIKLVPIQEIYFLCIITALVVIFTSAASFFWLNVMCFDIWWTLRKMRSMRGNVQQRKRKKFVIYSIYAWGGALVFTSVSAIMDFFPGIPKTWVRPQLCIGSIWFYTDLAELLYFWGPIYVIIIFNICLFISTARKIVYHKKTTTRQLKSSDSRCHIGMNNREQRFGVYLKLFIVMGMSWSLEIVSMVIDLMSACVPMYFWYIIGLPNSLQGIVIFIILVCKKKIINLLIKRLGCRFCPRRNVTNSDCLSSFSRTTASGVIPLQKVNLRS